MRVIALLAFYDEPPASLITSIASLKQAGVDHLVALDGAFALYPDGKAASDANQHAAIVMTCRELGIGCTLSVPTKTWQGEPEKRTALFALGWAVAEDGDWFMVHDADMVITRWNVTDELGRTENEVAKVEILDTVAQRANQRDWPPFFDFCGLFKAQPITVGPHHAQYRAADGQHLWVGNGEDPPVPVLDLTDQIRVEHRPDNRPVERLQGKLGYYRIRDEEKVERGTCRCGAPSVQLVPTKWRWTHLGPVGDWAEACEPCGVRIEKVNRRMLMQMGVDPDSFVAENRNGKAPSGMTA